VEIVIHEFMASNASSVSDEAGEFNDWIELYNNTQNDISLLGYYLTDNTKEPAKWALPDVSLAANSYLIVWADEDGSQGEMHANFKLSASGETIALVNSAFEIVDSISFGLQTTDLAYARVPNGTGDFVIQEQTFGANNVSSSLVNQTITINKGWNLISFYVEPTDKTVLSVFSGVDFNLLKSSEHFYKKGQTDFLQGIKEITAGVGYLLNSNEATTISINGIAVDDNFTTNIGKGWSLIGVPNSSDVAITTLSNKSEFELIKDFDAFYDSDEMGSLQTLQPGKAYFLKLNNNVSINW